MSKQELKQRIAEVFADINIRYKSQYIRDLIESEVSEDLTVVRTETLNNIRRKINNIDERQINGYQTFKDNTEYLELIRKEIINMKITVFFVSFVYALSFLISVL